MDNVCNSQQKAFSKLMSQLQGRALAKLGLFAVVVITCNFRQNNFGKMNPKGSRGVSRNEFSAMLWIFHAISMKQYLLYCPSTPFVDGA